MSEKFSKSSPSTKLELIFRSRKVMKGKLKWGKKDMSTFTFIEIIIVEILQ